MGETLGGQHGMEINSELEITYLLKFATGAADTLSAIGARGNLRETLSTRMFAASVCDHLPLLRD